MKNKQGRLLFCIAIIIAFVLLGFLRDFLFVHLNYQIAKLYYKDYNYTLPDFVSFLGNFSYAGLNNLKWVFTVLFLLLYFLLTIITVKQLFPAKIYFRITAFFYLGVVILGAIAYIFGVVVFSSDRAYNIALFFTHMVQSPIVIMILIPAFKLAPRKDKQND